MDPATGNRTQSVRNPVTGSGATVTDSYSYPGAGVAHPHAVQSVAHTTVGVGAGTSSSGYVYDASGGTVSRPGVTASSPGQTLSYDSSGRVESVTVGGVEQSNIYDASGALLMQSDATSGVTLFLGDTELHAGQGAAASEVSAVRTYSTPDGTPVAERTTAVGADPGVSVLRWVTTDIDKTSDLEVDVASGVVTRRFQDPFGNVRGALPVSGWSSSHGFLNAPTSTLTSLTQLGARAYLRSIGDDNA